MLEDCKTAGIQPQYGEISFDRAANELFAEKVDVPEEQKDEAKGMALLFRSELKKTEDVK